jgi:hypothetical protein
MGDLAFGNPALGNRFFAISIAISTLDKPLFGTLLVRSLTMGWVDGATDIN